MAGDDSQTVTIASPIGKLTLEITERALMSLHMGRFSIGKRIPAKYRKQGLNTLLAEITGQLQDYFDHAEMAFDLPLQVLGSDFQKSVWRALSKIPSGEVKTYAQIARQLGTHPRAIGMACRNNPTPIIVPCHRVIATNGLGGFDGKTSGSRLALKQWLLEHEGVQIQSSKAF